MNMAEWNRGKHPGNYCDLTGRVFSRLTVTARSGIQRSFATWLCRCECGKNVVVTSVNLKSGVTKSCGCLKADLARARQVTHGMFDTREYACWRNMISRCTLPGADRKKRYFHRGIKVCERWLGSFESFYADMGPRPSDKHSIERKDNDGDYGPDHCEWAVRTKQTRNRNTSKLITHNGETHSLAEWAERLGFNYKTIFRRLSVGEDFASAIARPIRKLTKRVS
jgi:hypothetical protein